MEEIYILSDGSQVDLSSYSQFEKTNFLIKNPGAKKSKGIAKSATVMPKKNQALTKDTDSNLADGSLDSKKFRLATEKDLETAQKKGIMPPPSSLPKVKIDDYETLYTLKQNIAKEKATKFEPTEKVKLPEQRVSQKMKGKLSGSKEEIKDFVDNFRDNPVTGELGYDNLYKIKKAKEAIQENDVELDDPYMYYSSYNQGELDTFVEDNFAVDELKEFNINTQNFDGFLNKKGYKQDFLEKQSKGLFEGKGRNFWGGYDVGLAKELAKKKLLNLYMEDMQRRDVTRQDLNQEIEIAVGVRDKKEIVQNELFDKNKLTKYVEKNFPIVTQKLKDRDLENAKIYEESKKGGTDFFSWDTAEKIGRAGWNAITDRTAQLTATAYEKIGMSATSEGVRMLDEENKLVRPDDRGVGYVSGRAVKYKDTTYLVDSKGEVYDTDSKIRVTDLFNEKEYGKIVETSKYGPEDWMFSTQGAAVQTSGVMADMLLQAALTKGVGELGSIATVNRNALNLASKTSKFTPLLNDTSQLLRKVPLDRSVGYSMIAQGTLGYSQGYEDTLKAARDNGINDKDAFELANAAGQRMAVLYSTTGVINPQTKVVDNIFGSKNIIKKAIEQYTKTGKTGFVEYIDDIIKSTPRNLLEFAEEGGKEVVQENTQQIGEIGINKMTNRDAGKKIMNEVMSGDDFMNTSILSFISSGLISKAKIPNFTDGNEYTDNLSSLSTLAKNKTEFTKIIDDLMLQKVFTADQVNNLKKDVEIYSNNINKLPKKVSAESAMPIMRELDKITELQNEKKKVDVAFHEDIDDKIDTIRQDVKKIFYADQLRIKNKAIKSAIEKGVVKTMQMKTFSTTDEVVNYLVNEVNMPLEEAKDSARKGGFFLDEDILKEYALDPSTIKKGQKVIVVNEEVGARGGASEIVQHEFLHGLIHETVKNDPEAQKLLGTSLAKELMKIKDRVDLSGNAASPVPTAFVKRFNKYVSFYQKKIATEKALLETGDITQQEYDEKVDVYLGNQWEEVLTLYSDAISNGSVVYDEGTFSKLKDVIRRLLQQLGVKNIEFNSGKDVYNFIRDYNKSVETGTWGIAMKRLGERKAKINREALRKETGVQEKTTQAKSEPKYSLGERKSSEDIKKDINKTYNKDTWTKDVNSDRKTTLYDILNEYEYIINGKAKGLGYINLPDFSPMDFVSETQIAMIPHIRNFNKEFLAKREEYKQELESKGLDPNSKEFKDKVEAQDEKGYKGKKGIVKENDDLNAWINSQLANKMKDALKTGNVTSQMFTDDIQGEGFKETRILSEFGGETGEKEGFLDESDSVFDAEQDFEEEQSKLAVLLSDPVFSFVDENGKPVNIETVPFGSFFITEVSDPSIAANKKLRTEKDPAKIAELNSELRDLERGLELQNKKDITFEEKEELKGLKSFKSYDLSTGMMVNTFKALSIQDTPAKIITDDISREILRSPNVETLEYRNFKEKLSTLSKTMSRRITFKNGPEIESFMYNQWKLIYDVINHPVDQVTGESSYASKKLPPRLKEFDEKGDLKKISNISRVKFLQSYYGTEEASRIIKIYGGSNASEELKQFEDPELNEKTGKGLVPTAYFDRRTALMELFGDVLVLQEARRLLRQPEFLDRIADRNVNLYNGLKDDVIRAEVLKNMSKGKSDIVKFSLPQKQKVRKKPGYITTNPLNMIGDNPMYSLKYDELFSSPSDFIKFSLADIEENAPEPVSKFKDSLAKVMPLVDDLDGWVLKTIQLSDIQDDDIKVKKLHGLKSGEKIVKEVERRYNELVESLYTPFLQNDWVIKEYKEGYIDTMLERSINIPEENFHTPYWSRMKNDENFRQSELENTQIQQHFALRQLMDNLNSSDFLDGNDLLFFRYLFLKDVLSSRYYIQSENNIIKKSVKKSEYKTTIQPIQEFNDTKIISDIWNFYSNKKSNSLAAIYLLKSFMEKPVDFEGNFIQEVDENTSLYKFNRGTDEEEVNRLNKLASYSNRSGYRYCSWCTGSSKSMAASQLKNGDFYIIANSKSKIPVLAIRYVGEEIAEMAGTRENQDLWEQDFKAVEFAINNLPSENKELALNQFETAKKLLNLTNDEIREIDSENTLEKLKLSKNINIHFGKEVYEKSRTVVNALRNLVTKRQLKSGASLLEMYKTGFNIDDDGKSNIKSETDLDTLKMLTEFTENVTITLNITSDDIDYLENVVFVSEDLKLNELTKAKVLNLDLPGFSTLEAKKLTNAEALQISFERYHENPYLSLPAKIDYNIDLTFFSGNPDETPEITIFDNEIDMSNQNLGLYFNDQEVDGVLLSNVKNTSNISVSGVITDYINLPKKIRSLETENIYGKSGAKVEISGLEELEILDMEWAGFDDLWFSKLKTIGTLSITLRHEYDSDYEDIIRDTKIFKKAENVNFIYEDHQSGNYVNKKLKSKPTSDAIKFSLAEENNGRISNLLEGLPFTEQWIVARDMDNAIKNSKITDGTKVTFKVPSRSKMSDKSTAYFIIQKVAEGYNDFEFLIKKNAKGPLTTQVLNSLDLKSKEIQEIARLNNNLERTMNEIIEQNKGVEASETFSPETAKNLGKNIGKYDIYLPPEDEDFLGLLYTLGSARGKIGESQMKFLVDNLLKPYSDAMLNLMKARQTMYKDWKELINKKYKNISKELKKDSGYGGYTVDQAVRVYLWSVAGYDIPGLDKKDLFNLREIVRTNPKLRNFAQDVSLLSKQANGYTEPDHNWGFGSVVGDINNVISKSNRVKFLEHWQNNIDKVFSKQNMSKIEALYGRKYVKALENMLYRMKTGTNRAEGASDSLLNWINGSTAVTMFWNVRSALLQTLGSVNYINTGDNNILKAGMAFVNQKQYWEDFFTIWNSDYLKDRRSGLMNDVAEAEFAQMINDSRNKDITDKLKAANYWLLKKGFGPTRAMDSFAIALGGATFYRNRLKTYIKEGYSEEDAKKATMRDFYETSEISQQSADVSKISANQASTKGRLLLSFMNTPFQYSRIIKKSFIDLVKGRGSVPNNVAKIMYYSTIQNLMFNFLQNAMFSMFWEDDDEQEEGKFDKGKIRTLNGAFDTLLRGTGMKGVLLSSVKNALIKWYEKHGDPKGYGDVAIELANVSPSIGIKVRALAKSYKAIEYNFDEIMWKGFSLDNTYAIEALTSITSGAFNLPVDRLYLKAQNIKNALDDQYETWQRVFFALGYSEWNLGLGESSKVQVQESGGVKIEELKMEELTPPGLEIPE